MRCDECGKKKATVHLTELVDGQISELHLCEECAKEKSVQMEQQFGLADLLAGLSDFGKTSPSPSPSSPEIQQAKIESCANCGMTYADFKKHGRLGCSDCYSHFRSRLGSLLKKIHGASQHSGKSPKVLAAPVESAQPVVNDLDTLKKQLQQAVLCEDYERAAELRDRIRAKEQEG